MRISPPSSPSAPRRGAVLLAVLVVVVVMALIAYNYSDRTVAAYQGAANAHRAAQLKAFADSGVAYAAALLSSPDAVTYTLGGNPYDNPDRFANVPVADSQGLGQGGTFTLIAPADPDQGSVNAFRAGVTCEASKININSAMKRDATGEQLYKMLMKLPNMNIELAACIVDYVDPDVTPREGGAEDEYYGSVSPPSRCKNGPLDSLDELLFVKGMTREILYGVDLNRNGIPDADESGFTASSDRGLAAFLTVSSREANRDANGQPYINVNGDDLSVIGTGLAPLVPMEVVNFIILYRQYGPTAAAGSTQSQANAIVNLLTTGRTTTTNNNSNNANQTIAGNLSNYSPDLTKAGSKKLTSFLDLVGAQVSVPGAMNQPTMVFTSPFSDAKTISDSLGTLYQIGSMNDDPEIPARISVLTAPREVLMCIDGLTDVNVESIINARPKWGSVEPPSAEFQSLAWLVSQAGISLTSLKTLEKVITTRSQVYHMQVVGQFDNGTGSNARVEAIVDANYGRPRILFYRDWSELGRTKLPQ